MHHLSTILAVINDEPFLVAIIGTLCNTVLQVRLEHRLTRIETILEIRKKSKDESDS